MTRRTLTLKAERLAELTTGDLRAVRGGDVSKLACVTDVAATCRPSDIAISLCGCFTEYCSIDVC